MLKYHTYNTAVCAEVVVHVWDNGDATVVDCNVSKRPLVGGPPVFSPLLKEYKTLRIIIYLKVFYTLTSIKNIAMQTLVALSKC